MSQVSEFIKSKKIFKSENSENFNNKKNNKSNVACDGFYEIPFHEMPAKRETDKRY